MCFGEPLVPKFLSPFQRWPRQIGSQTVVWDVASIGDDIFPGPDFSLLDPDRSTQLWGQPWVQVASGKGGSPVASSSFLPNPQITIQSSFVTENEKKQVEWLDSKGSFFLFIQNILY